MATYDWYEPDAEEDEAAFSDEPIEYDLTVTASDFNTKTIYDFIETGVVYVPGFQRNYVWDIKRASKLIESLIIGLPVPQLFLYEESRNRFLIIDGQQRLLSMFYFMKQRFPLLEKRGALRRIIEDKGIVTDEILHDEEFFANFNLRLPERVPGQANRFNNLNYRTLPPEYRTQFDLRPIRSIIVKQVSPDGNDSAMYEIFNRLNSGGVNLTPQEIRSSLYHSRFYEMLFRLNSNTIWRKFVGLQEPDLHIKDIEFLLRAFAMLLEGDKYNPSMIKFLNRFSKEAKGFSVEMVATCEEQFARFMTACELLDDRAFRAQTNRFSVTIFESVFCAVVRPFMERREYVEGLVDPLSVTELKENPEFLMAASRGTTNTSNVERRLEIARAIIRLK